MQITQALLPTMINAALSQQQTADAIAVRVLKKTLDIQAQQATQLLDTLPSPATSEPNLGQHIDTSV